MNVISTSTQIRLLCRRESERDRITGAMDVKSLAKSKRAHSQHHSKKHHSKSTTAKPPTKGPTGATTANKLSGKGVKEEPHPSQNSKGALPSNCDRYEEDYDSDLDARSKSTINPATDGFAPKSKGADYKYLLSEAKLQSEANILSDSFPSFDDVLSDFSEGFGPLLSARGASILSWSGDDNFIVEDKATATKEASFLSLNLHLLAEKLEKVELSRRLFIEPELFLADLSSEDIRTSGEESDQVQVVSQIQKTEILSDELIGGHPKNDNLEDEEAGVDLPLNSFNNTHFFNSSGPNKFNDMLSGRQEETVFKMESTSNFDKAPGLHIQRDSGVAIDFDDDLDNLLKETPISLSGRILSVQSAHSQPWVGGPDFSESASKMNYDDDLDDLLVETSSNINHFGEISSGHSGPSQSSKMDQDICKPSSLLSDFDDELDNLLKETSSKKCVSHSRAVDSSQLGHASSSKLSDDFDTFFDSL